MQIRIISSKEEITSVDEDEKLVHFAFRPSMKDVLELLGEAPKVTLIEIPESYNATLSKGLYELLEMKGVTLIISDVWGHRTDLCEYANIPVENVRNLSDEGVSVKGIAMSTGLKESMISYILR